MGCTSGSEIPRSPEFEDSFRHRSFTENICRIKSPRTRDGFASTRALPGKIRVNLRNPRSSGRKKEMPDRASLATRHLVDVSNQTKTELCVTVVSLSLDFFRCRGLNGMFADFSAGLAVDLCLSAK